MTKVNRIDILFDRLVDFPRRIIQLLESYLRFLEPESKEHADITAVLDMFTSIFVYSNDNLNKMGNFQACLNLQQILLESSNFKENIANAEHPLIKQVKRDSRPCWIIIGIKERVLTLLVNYLLNAKLKVITD